MNSTTTQPLDFAKDMTSWFIKAMLNAIDEGTKQAYRIISDALIEFLAEHWLYTIGILAVILIYAFMKFIFTGRWKTLGSVLYTYTYYGILFIISLIFGPEVFANDWFKLVLFLAYVISFVWVGYILDKSKIR